jgi:CheY-like chemotaxis protein
MTVATKPHELANPVACVADDDVEMRSFIGIALRGIGFAVRELSDGAALVEYLRRSACPDLVVTDLQMPGFTGMRVIRYARRLGLTMPIILVTGFAHPNIHVKAARAGAAAVLDKPFCVTALCELAQSLVAAT